MNVYGPACTTRQVNLTTAFVKISNQPARRWLGISDCAQVVTYAFVPTGGTAPTVGHTLAAGAALREQMAPGGDLYMKAAAAATCIITE